MAPAVIADSWGGYEDGHDMCVVDPKPVPPRVHELCSGCAALSETNAGNQELAGKGFSHEWDLEYVWKQYLHHYYQSTMYFAPPLTDRHESEETAVQQIAKRVRRKKVGGSTSTAHGLHNSHPAPAPHSSSSSSSSGSIHGHSTTSHASGTPASQPAKPSSSSAAPAGAARPAPVQLPDHSNSQVGR